VPGFAELVLILLVVLVIWGAFRLPALATAAGKAIQRMRRAAGHSEDDDSEEESEGDSESSS
jgi:TatA/E family protein of Tat protein translocase